MAGGGLMGLLIGMILGWHVVAVEMADTSVAPVSIRCVQRKIRKELK